MLKVSPMGVDTSLRASRMCATPGIPLGLGVAARAGQPGPQLGAEEAPAWSIGSEAPVCAIHPTLKLNLRFSFGGLAQGRTAQRDH